MALRKNGFDPIIIKLLDAITDLHFISYLSHVESNKSTKRIEKSVREGRPALAAKGRFLPIASVSSRLFIPDLFGKAFTHICYGNEGRQDEELIAVLTEVNCRMQAQCLCVLYEVFERFLKEFAPPLFYRMRKSWVLPQRERFHKGNRSMGKAENRNNTSQYFEAYVSFIAKHNCDELIAELMELLPRLGQLAISNWRSDLLSDHRLVSCIRHTTVHRNGEIDTHGRRKLQGVEIDAINSMTQVSLMTGKETILPSTDDAKHFLDSISAFSYAIYRIASEECKMKIMDFKTGA